MIRLACAAVLLGACSLYGGGDDCVQNAGAPLVPAQEFRDPANGQCEAIGGGGTCNNQCGPCPEATGAAGAGALPDWGTCYGSCEGLAETACLASSSCHAAYQYQGNGAQTPTFWGCWELPPTGPLTGTCTGLDAQTCSEHTDCISTYDGYLAPGTASTFDHCAPEPAPSCDAVDCGPGAECVLQGTTPGSFSQTCVAPTDAGSCDGMVSCNIAPPACPDGFTRGVANGCYTAYCIPTAACPSPACTTLTTEVACKARPDCDTIYDGSNCTCDAHGCTCQTQTFARCAPL